MSWIEIDTQNEKTIHNQSKLSDKSSSRIREKLPLPDLGIMKRMMSSIHNSNQNAEIRDKSASQRKLEVCSLFFSLFCIGIRKEIRI